MRMLTFVPGLALLSVLVFGASLAIAEKVEHHGNTVEAVGTAESCIACHDGLVAENVSYCTVNCDFSNVGGRFMGNVFR